MGKTTHDPIMIWRPLGDAAWLMEPGGTDPAERLARVLGWLELIEDQRIKEVSDVVPAPDSLAVHTSPEHSGTVLNWLNGLPQPGDTPNPPNLGRMVEIPVCYGPPAGFDLDETARSLGMSACQLIELHCQPLYTVSAIGFSPGFPYLTGLNPRLHVPRKATPKPVAAGTVAIAGSQTGIYPFASQGGWQALGQTNAVLFNPLAPTPATLRVGDRVRFQPVESLQQKPAPSATAAHPAGTLLVTDPGPLTTIQDRGRPGFQHAGVSPGGAADPITARVANRLAGNPPETALLECALSGPLLHFLQPARVATIGWDQPDDGRPRHFSAGESLDLRCRMRLLRGYIAVSGGILTPEVLGSRATDVRACFGGQAGRPLRHGELLAVGKPESTTPTVGPWRVAWPHNVPAGRTLEVRFLPGMQAHWFTAASRATFMSPVYQTSTAGDRTGVRLDGPPLTLGEKRQMVSQPVVRGSIQVPPDGRPIVLLAECQTIGGYPQIGHVISADLPALARALPGTRLHFREVSLEEARAAWHDLQRELARLETGLKLVP